MVLSHHDYSGLIASGPPKSGVAFLAVGCFSEAIAKLNGQIEQAIEYARMLLDPAQMRLPDPLDQALNQAILCWENKNADEVSAPINRTVEWQRNTVIFR